MAGVRGQHGRHKTTTSRLAAAAFIVLKCRAGDGANAVVEVLADAMRFETRGIAYNPQYGLREEERNVVICDAGARATPSE